MAMVWAVSGFTVHVSPELPVVAEISQIWVVLSLRPSLPYRRANFTSGVPVPGGLLPGIRKMAAVNPDTFPGTSGFKFGLFLAQRPWLEALQSNKQSAPFVGPPPVVSVMSSPPKML